MLRKRNGFVQAAGFVAIAALMAGCQTGPKNVNMSFNEMYPDYGNDLEDGDAGRGLASAMPIKAFLELLRNPEIFRNAAQSAEVVEREFTSFINASKHPELAKLRKGGKKLELEDLNKISSAKVQGNIIKAFMDTRTGKKANSVLSAEADLIVKDARSGTQFAGSSAAVDARLAARKGNKNRFQYGKMDKDGNIAAPGDLTITSTRRRSTTIDAEFKGFDDRAEFQTAEGRELVANAKKNVGDYHKKTFEASKKRLIEAGEDPAKARGRSLVTKNACDNMDPAALKTYDELVADMNKTLDSEVPGRSGKRWADCANIAEVEAWMVAKFQSDKLAREGVTAWIAVGQMGECKFVPGDTAESANRKVAGGVNQINPPDCK